MRDLFLDFETFSATDIITCGSYKYMEDPEFDILLMAYAYDDEEVQQLDFTNPRLTGNLPQELEEAMTDPNIIKHAWNTAFERNAIHTHWGIYSPPEQWVDDMIVASYNGLPRSLDAAGKAIGLSEDKQKLKSGRELIRWFSKPTPAGKRRRPEDAPEKWEKYKEYNRQDVETERAIHHMMSRQPPKEEHRLWCIDQRMNERGVRVDIQLAHHAVEFDERYKAELTEEAIALTGIKNPNSVTQIKNYLKDKEGIEVESLNKTVLPDVLSSLKTAEAKKFMALRIEMARSQLDSLAQHHTQRHALDIEFVCHLQRLTNIVAILHKRLLRQGRIEGLHKAFALTSTINHHTLRARSLCHRHTLADALDEGFFREGLYDARDTNN